MSKKSSTFAPAFVREHDLYRLTSLSLLIGAPENFNFWGEEKAQPLHELHSNEVMDCRFRRGAVVQLVRIPACHAVGREFESRPHRKKESQM